MRRLTATQARRHWFRLLDEAANGEVFGIERHGKWVVIQLAEAMSDPRIRDIPAYDTLIDVGGLDEADLWSWKWSENGLTFVPSGDGSS